MAAKTISVETDAYELLAREKKDRTESFSRVIRRLFAERPVLTAGELLGVMQEFKGRGAGPRRRTMPVAISIVALGEFAEGFSDDRLAHCALADLAVTSARRNFRTRPWQSRLV